MPGRKEMLNKQEEKYLAQSRKFVAIGICVAWNLEVKENLNLSLTNS